MIDFYDLVVHGTVGPISRQATSTEVVNCFGEPDVHTPARKSYPEIIVYGDIEFRLRENQLRVVALTLGNETPRLPNNITVGGLPSTAERSRQVIEELLQNNEVVFEQDSVMSDEAQDVIVTGHGVHLVFVDQILVRVGVEECQNRAG